MKANSVARQSIQFKVLNENQCEQIIETAFRVLERTGCNMHNAEARELLQKAGCRLDGVRVRIPSSLIQKSLVTVPKQIIVYDREGNPALRLGARNGNSYIVAGMENQYRIDLETGEKRLTVKQDAAEAGLVIDALPNIDVACGLACISDCTPQLADVYELRMLLETTNKPIIEWAFNMENFKTQVEMCAVVAGGMDAFLQKPFLIAGAAPTVPLSHADDTVGKALYMFELGLPTPYIAACMMGGTSPVSMAGTVVQAVSEIMVGLVLSQLKNEGCPFIAGGFPDMLDMKTMSFSMSAPEYSLGASACTDVFKYLNIPTAVHLGCTDSPIFDQQAAFDIGVQLYTGLLAGANLKFFPGYLETAMSSSLSALVFCDEAIDYCKQIVKGFEVNEESLAEDVIHHVGPGGNFLGEEHTMKHFKESWMPKNFARMSYENWAAKGKRDLNERNKDTVREILAKGPRKSLTPEVLTELDAIVAKAETSYK